MKKEFSKFFIASLKRTAQNVAPLLRRKQKLTTEIEEKKEEMESIDKQVAAYDMPIKEVTGGYGVEDLVERVTEITDKLDKEGKPLKTSKWVLKYPETIIPEIEEAISEIEQEESSVEDSLLSDMGDIDVEPVNFKDI